MSTELTPEALDALPVGSKIYDCQGDELTKEEFGFWTYVPGQLVGTQHPTIWAPYSLVPPIDPADPQYDPKRDARR